MDYFNNWNRETSILFASMVGGSYAWIISERIFIGILIGLIAHLALTALYEAAARTLGLPHLSYVTDFEREYLPRIVRSIPRFRLNRRA